MQVANASWMNENITVTLDLDIREVKTFAIFTEALQHMRRNAHLNPRLSFAVDTDDAPVTNGHATAPAAGESESDIVRTAIEVAEGDAKVIAAVQQAVAPHEPMYVGGAPFPKWAPTLEQRPVQEPLVAVEPAPAPAETAPATHEDAIAAMRRCAERTSAAKVLEILNALGADRVRDLAPEQYGEFIRRAESA